MDCTHLSPAISQPLPVTVKVEKLNPSVKVIYYQTLDLKGTGDEQTAIRFTLSGDEVIKLNNRPKSLVEMTRRGGKRKNTTGGGPRVIDSNTGGILD